MDVDACCWQQTHCVVAMAGGVKGKVKGDGDEDVGTGAVAVAGAGQGVFRSCRYHRCRSWGIRDSSSHALPVARSQEDAQGQEKERKREGREGMWNGDVEGERDVERGVG